MIPQKWQDRLTSRLPSVFAFKSDRRKSLGTKSPTDAVTDKNLGTKLSADTETDKLEKSEETQNTDKKID